jgi:hypothetical protein
MINNYELLNSAPYFCTKFFYNTMEQPKKYKAFYWLLFLASTAGLALAIITHWPWLTLILPFVCTSFVKALDII